LTPTIRPVRAEEMRDAIPLLHAEGWTFDEAELARLHRLGGAVGAFDAGSLVAFLTYADLGSVRWVGNVVTAPTHRGKGLGAAIVEEAAKGAATVGLYAVEKAVTLYERGGFVAHGGDAWAHRAQDAKPLRPSVTQPMTRDDLLACARLDRGAMGCDRGYLLRELLRAYPDSARVVRSGNHVTGFGFAKTSAGLTELGPIVATTTRAGEDLLDALLATTSGPHEATALAANRPALDALASRGFAKSFRTITMFRGPPPAWRASQLFAAAGLEKG